MSNWTEKEKEFLAWGNGAARYLAAKGIVPAGTKWYDAGKHQYLAPYRELFTQFMTERGPLMKYESPDAATDAFVDWVESKYRLSGEQTGGRFTVRCKVLNLAKLEVEFEYSAHFNDETPEARARAWEFCSQVVRDAVSSYLSQTPMASGPQEGANERDTSFTANWITVEFTNGKKTYKIGGEYPFSRYGVRVWPEVLAAAGIDPETLQLGENRIQTARCEVLYQGAKPVKVTKIVFNG